MKEKTYWVIFDVARDFPMISKKPITIKKAEELREKSRVKLNFPELGLSTDFYYLGAFGYTENKEIAREVWKEKMMEWWEKEKDHCLPGMLEEIMGNVLGETE